MPVLKKEVETKPLLGICLGMQLLFDKSFEYGEHAGLGLIPGEVCPLADDLTDASLKVPHIGWNALDIVPGRENDPLFKYVKNGEYVYYVHSYYAKKLRCFDPCHQRVQHPCHRRGAQRQCLRHPVPPGEIRRYRPSAAESLRRTVS